MTHTHKVCGCCKECKPVAQFYRRAAVSDGLQPRCKACSNVKSRESMARHRARTTGAARQKWAAIAQEAARL